MPTSDTLFIQKSNALLSALPEADFALLSPHLKPVLFHLNQTLFEPEQTLQNVYFLKSGIISLVLVAANGTEVEVGLVGSEGVCGLNEALTGMETSQRAIVQAAGSGWSLPVDVLKNLYAQSAQFQHILLCYQNFMLNQCARSALCNRLHSVEERLSRWLLEMHDRSHTDDLEMTHEFLAAMLGTRRAGVTVAAGALRKKNLIDYTRGNIFILNRDGLEETACECYEISHKLHQRLQECCC